MNGVEEGPDGRPRCPWALGTPDYLDYHDYEWGRPLHGESELFERLTLEAFQSGLSWLTILRKRENFRRAFDGFDIERVAEYGDAEVERLLADAGIIRNRKKIEAAITNARRRPGAALAGRDARRADLGLRAGSRVPSRAANRRRPGGHHRRSRPRWRRS